METPKYEPQCPKRFYLWTTLLRHRRPCLGALMAHQCHAISVEKITKFLPFHQLSLPSASGYRADLAIAEPLPAVGCSSLPSLGGALPEPGRATYFSDAPQVATGFPQPDQLPSPSGATGPSGAPHIHGKSRRWGRRCISQCCAAFQRCTAPSFEASCTSRHAARRHHPLADPGGSVHIFPSGLESDTHPPTWKGTWPWPERSLEIFWKGQKELANLQIPDDFLIDPWEKKKSWTHLKSGHLFHGTKLQGLVEALELTLALSWELDRISSAFLHGTAQHAGKDWGGQLENHRVHLQLSGNPRIFTAKPPVVGRKLLGGIGVTCSSATINQGSLMWHDPSPFHRTSYCWVHPQSKYIQIAWNHVKSFRFPSFVTVLLLLITG